MDHLKDMWLFAIAGLSGAFTSISLHKDKKSPVEVVVFIISGMLTAVFVAPLISKWLGLTGEESVAAVSFLTGACWNTVISKALDWFKGMRFGGGNGMAQ